ncbi:hypothetical protein [Modestobacter roseus]|uniref:O-antigen/teichoic acid export membrane protein n=1 Tax=Modestobacter roseus TaxID=1181884 RepID=A0A562IWD9_9ACTN|nr:hypothetical protein [Modestobacter roseus]MQA33380.1 hypothetical protein [Modestobacter roseus]TWH75298.1 O-antigen/teichoic acid export membrane protein [Modestobacter roseus]
MAGEPAVAGEDVRPGRERLFTLLDQGLSSVTNFALSLVAARELGVAELGAFAVAAATYLIALGLVRAACGETLLVRYGGAAAGQWPALTRASTGLAAGAGCLIAVVVAVAGLVVGGRVGPALLGLAATLPALLVQDAWRYCFLGRGRAGAAAALDGVWAVLLVPAFATLLLADRVSAGSLLLAWGLAGAASLPVALAVDRSVPDLLLGRRFLRDNSQLIRRYCLESLTGFGAYQLLVYGLAAQFGLALAGALRLATTALSPVNVLFQGAYTIATLRSVRLRDRGSAEHLRWSVTVGAALAVVAVVWTAVLLLLPSSWVVGLLGPEWPEVRGVVALLGVWLVAIGLQSGAATGLHGLADSGRSLTAQLLSAPALLVLAWAGAVLAGVTGVAVGYAAAGAVSGVVWWTLYRRSLRQGTRVA